MPMVSVQVALSLGYGSNAIKYSLFFCGVICAEFESYLVVF